MSCSRYAIIRKRLITPRVTRRYKLGFATASRLSDEQQHICPKHELGNAAKKIVNSASETIKAVVLGGTKIWLQIES